jgi:predicted lipoprotein
MIELAHGYIMPLHRDFESSMSGLDAAAQVFCAAPDATSLGNVQDIWRAARVPFKQIEIFNFGPFEEEPVRLGAKIDFWPARQDSIESTLSSDRELTPESVGALGAASRGLPVIEYLLFHSESGEVLDSFTDDDGRRCAYLVAAVGDTASMATELREAWDPEVGGFLNELTRAGAGSTTFPTVESGVTEVVNRMGFICENIRRDKVNPQIGEEVGVAQPEKVESRFSDNGLEDIKSNLLAVESLFTGTYKDNQVAGWDSFLKSRGVDLEPLFMGHLNTARAALDSVERPLTQAIFDDPDSFGAVLEPLRQLQILIQTEMLSAMGLAQTFNDNDGD